MTLYSEALVARTLGVEKKRIEAARKSRLRQGADWELAGREIAYNEAGLEKLLRACRVGPDSAKRVLVPSELLGATAALRDMASRVGLRAEYSDLRALARPGPLDHLAALWPGRALNGHANGNHSGPGPESTQPGVKGTSAAEAAGMASAAAETGAEGGQPDGEAEPAEVPGTDSIAGVLLEGNEEDGRSQESGVRSQPEAGKKALAPVAREAIAAVRAAGGALPVSLTVVRISPNPIVIECRAAEWPAGKTVRVRVRENRNFVPGMRALAWPSTDALTGLWRFEGNLPRFKGKY